MKWLSCFLKGLVLFFRKLFIQPYRAFYVEEKLPKKLRDKTVYLVREDGFLEYAAMRCPCGCGNTLYLNLIPDDYPCWQITLHPKHVVSLRPSVWRQIGCRSHFWVKRGHVHWC